MKVDSVLRTRSVLASRLMYTAYCCTQECHVRETGHSIVARRITSTPDSLLSSAALVDVNGCVVYVCVSLYL